MDKKKTMTDERFIDLALKHGIELTEEQLESFSGGAVWSSDGKKRYTCPYCGSQVTPTNETSESGKQLWYCGICDEYFV